MGLSNYYGGLLWVPGCTRSQKVNAGRVSVIVPQVMMSPLPRGTLLVRFAALALYAVSAPLWSLIASRQFGLQSVLAAKTCLHRQVTDTKRYKPKASKTGPTAGSSASSTSASIADRMNAQQGPTRHRARMAPKRS